LVRQGKQLSGRGEVGKAPIVAITQPGVIEQRQILYERIVSFSQICAL